MYDLRSDEGWAALRRRYASPQENSRPAPLERCLQVASSAQTAVVEFGYRDFDYSSEFASYYTKTFASFPDITHRIHFFSAALGPSQLLGQLPSESYMGYVVVRPSALGRVGRTVLAPPKDLAAAIRTSVPDTVNLFGQDLTVSGVPFMQQDMHLGRCAHTSAWVCHYSAFRRGYVGRQPMGAFSIRADTALGLGRPIPSEGLTVEQLLQVLTAVDLPPAVNLVKHLPKYDRDNWTRSSGSTSRRGHPGTWDRDLVKICCQYLNSGFPVIVTTDNHAFVLCGWKRDPAKAPRTRRGRRSGKDAQPGYVKFYRQDDQAGPYVAIDDLFNDVDPRTGVRYSPWESVIVPLPEKLWLPPWAAERMGQQWLTTFAEAATRGGIDAAGRIGERLAHNQLAMRTYAVPSNEFKRSIAKRVDPRLADRYRLTRFPRWIWIVEAVDRERRHLPECVLGEAVLDGTSSENEPELMGVHVPGAAWVAGSNGFRCTPGYYASGGVGPA